MIHFTEEWYTNFFFGFCENRITKWWEYLFNCAARYYGENFLTSIQHSSRNGKCLCACVCMVNFIELNNYFRCISKKYVQQCVICVCLCVFVYMKNSVVILCGRFRTSANLLLFRFIFSMAMLDLIESRLEWSSAHIFCPAMNTIKNTHAQTHTSFNFMQLNSVCMCVCVHFAWA